MSLVFGAASTDRVALGTGISLTEFTWLLWYYPTSNTGPQNLMWKTTASGRHNIERKFGDVDDFEVQVQRATTIGTCATTGVDRPLNAWKFLAVTVLDADGGPRVFHGSLTALAVEASYSSRAEGTGAIESGSGLSMSLGNGPTWNEPLIGRIGAVAVINRKLSLGEIQSWQYRPRMIAGCVGFWRLGWNGTGSQPDWSGTGNAGTVTGATVGDDVPLGRFRRRGALFLPSLAPTTEWFFLDSAAGGWPILQMGGTAPSPTTTSTGWRVEGLAAGQFARMAYGVVRAASTFTGTAQPSGAPDNTLKDCWRSATPLSGTVAAGDWLPSLPLIAVVGDGANVRVRFRLWRSTNADGSSATEITSGAIVGSTITALTGTQQVSAGSVALPAVTLAKEYLFVQIALETL